MAKLNVLIQKYDTLFRIVLLSLIFGAIVISHFFLPPLLSKKSKSVFCIRKVVLWG